VLRLRKGHSINERVVSLHLLEDVLGWVAVLVAAVVMKFVSLPILDPLLSVAITLWVLGNVYRNLRNSFQILLQAVPAGKDIAAIKQQLETLAGVAEIHDIHLWSLDGEQEIFTVHIKVDATTSLDEAAEIKERIRYVLAQQHIGHCTIEVESTEETCLQVDC
jgi:cobalt-zinc-cadmium efflux system protein